MSILAELSDWLMLLAQEGAGNAKKEGQAQPGFFGGLGGLLLPIGMIVVLYIFLMVLPQRREQNRFAEMLGSLKKNDRVLAAGGIIATVVNVQKDSEYVTLKIDETSNAKMRVLKSSISRILSQEETKEKPEGTTK